MDRQIIKALLIAGAIIFVLGDGFFFVFSKAMGPGSGNLTGTEMVTQATNLKFPKGAEVLGGKYTLFMNRIYVIGKVSMPAATVREFIQQPGFSRLVRNQTISDYLDSSFLQDMKEQGWSPELARNTLAVTKEYPDDKTGNVYCLFDLDDPKQAVLYIYRNW